MRALFAFLLAVALTSPACAETIKGEVVAGTTLSCDMSCTEAAVGEFPPEMFVWLDASLHTTLTGALGNVSVWRSRVGSVQFEQGGSNDVQPDHSASIANLNGQAGVAFGGYMSCTATPVGTSNTGEVWFAYETNNVATDAQTLYSQMGASGTNYIAFYAIQYTTRFGFAFWNGVGADYGVGDTVLSSNTPYVVRGWSNGSTYAQQLNGASESITFGGGANNGYWWADVTNIESTLGYNSSYTQALNGSIGEMFLDNAVLPAWASTARTVYLVHKFIP